MNRFQRKLRCRRGETLVESLCAILIVTCGSVLLATMLLSASHLNQTAGAQDTSFYAALSAAESEPTDPAPAAEIQVTDTDTGRQYSFPVTLYGTDGDLTAYRLGGKGA